MNIIIAGANGTTGKQIVELLIENDYTVMAIVRKPSEANELQKLGAKTLVADLATDDFSYYTSGAEAAIFVAKSNPDSSEDETWEVDHDGAIRFIEACEENAVNRFIMLSSTKAKADDQHDTTFHKAKADADKKLQKSNLNYTIFRVKKLTDGVENEKVNIKEKLDNPKEITRLDIAQVIFNSLENNHTYKKVLEVEEGDTPIPEALNYL
jgi:nucleoside-diphosphate-sugar epimerase